MKRDPENAEAIREPPNTIDQRWPRMRTFLAIYGLSVVVTVVAARTLGVLLRWTLS
jgi:hypothetical protein